MGVFESLQTAIKYSLVVGLYSVTIALVAVLFLAIKKLLSTVNTVSVDGKIFRICVIIILVEVVGIEPTHG